MVLRVAWIKVELTVNVIDIFPDDCSCRTGRTVNTVVAQLELFSVSEPVHEFAVHVGVLMIPRLSLKGRKPFLVVNTCVGSHRSATVKIIETESSDDKILLL